MMVIDGVRLAALWRASNCWPKLTTLAPSATSPPRQTCPLAIPIQPSRPLILILLRSNSHILYRKSTRLTNTSHNHVRRRDAAGAGSHRNRSKSSRKHGSHRLVRTGTHKSGQHCSGTKEKDQEDYGQEEEEARQSSTRRLLNRKARSNRHNLQHLVQQVVWRRSRRCILFQATSKGQV
jgi:hypothetical protein